MPELQGIEIVEPLRVCAEALNGEPLGKEVAPGIRVAVCAKPSLFLKRIVLPTGTVNVSGKYPS